MNRTYQFTFSKSRAIAAIATFCFLLFLAFTGGLAIGLGLRMPTRTEIALTNEYFAKPAAALDTQAEEQFTNVQEGRFTLQVGSFADANNAKQLESELRDRGYPVRISKALDAGKRVWHVVRVGDYADVITATRAAAEFSNREQLQALVGHIPLADARGSEAPTLSRDR